MALLPAALPALEPGSFAFSRSWYAPLTSAPAPTRWEMAALAGMA